MAYNLSRKNDNAMEYGFLGWFCLF